MLQPLRAHSMFLSTFMAAVIAAWQIGQPLQAATFLWTDVDGNTSVGVNWSAGVSPNAISLAGDVFNFNNAITAPRTVTLDGLLTGGAVNIGDTSSTNGFTLAAGTGGYLVLDATSGNATITKTGNGLDAISAGLQFNDTLAITNSATAGTLTLSGALRSLRSDITFNGTGAVSTGSIAVSGVISTAGNLVKNDAGITLLSGANTYAGTTTINGGTLQLSNAAALPARSAVFVAAGATLDYLNTAPTIGSLSGGGTVTASTASAARVLTIGRDDTSTTFNGQFFGPAGQKARLAITKVGAGTLTLAPLSGSSATAAGDYTGATVINGGSLRLDFSQGTFTGTSMLAATTPTIAGGNLLVKGRSGASINQTLGNLTLGAGGGSVIIDNNGGAATRLNFGTITSTAAGGSLLVNSPTGADVRFNQALNTATTVNGRIVFTDGAGNFNWAANTGVNTTTVGLATYTDVAGGAPTGTDTNNSRIASATASQTTTPGGAWTTNSLRINAGATGQSLALGANNLTLTNGGLLFTGANDYTISSTTGTLASGTATNSDLVIHNYGTGNLTIGAIIANGVGNSTLTTAGTGRVTLTGANTFTGAIIVGGTSTLSFNNVASGGAGGLGTGVRTSVTIRDGATLRYTGPTGTIGAANSTAGTHIYTLQGGNANIEVTDSAANLTLNGIISGAGGLTKLGLGTLTLASQDGAGTAANSTYTGPTFINAGTLSISGADRLPDLSPVTLASGATLNISAGNDTIGSLAGAGVVAAGTTARTLTMGGDNTSTTFTGTLTGAAAHVFVKQGTGVMTIQLGGATAWTGNSSVTAGTLRLNNTNGLPSTGAWTMGNSAQPAQLDLNGFNASVAGLSFYGTASAISSEGTVSLGGGTVTLTGNSTVNNNNNPRAALITGGTLTMTAARTFDVRDSTSVLATDAELLITSNWSGAAGGITKVGGGNLRITGTNSMTGATANTFNSGITWLDYTTNNTDKINDTGALAFGGGTVILTGNNSAATAQTVAGLTLTSGSSVLTLNAGSGQTLALDLGAITRATSGGGIRFNLPTGTASSSNGVVTTQANVNGILGGYATATDGSGTGFATNSSGNIVVLASTAKDDVTTWSAGEDITDSSGFTGTLGSSISINTLRFNAAGPSTVTIGTGNTLEVASGGILQTSSVSGGTSLITGGTLSSNTGNELIFTVDSATQRLEVASAITGATAITKLGNGTLRLSGAHTSIGTVNLYSGTLQVSGGNAFGDAAALVISANKSSVFEVLASEAVGSLSGGQNQANLAGEIRIASGAALTINQSVNGTYSGSITGSGTFIKSGTGTLVIDAAATTSLVSANSFTGGVTINRGILEFNGAAGSLSGAASWTVNGGGALYSNKNSTTTADAIGNTVGIMLNNTNQGGAVFNTEGLVHRTNQGSTRAETIASLTLGAGHNTVTAFGNATNAIADLIIGTSAGILRTDRATALVRGNALGASSGTRSQIRVSDATGNTALDTAEVGGGGAAATSNISIIPWLVGHLSETGLGNTFVTNTVAANGLRPLASTEYVNDNLTITGALTDNVRFTTGGTITGAPTTINSLVLDGATGLILNGPASSTEITSGALLSAQAVANVIDTFTGLTTGGGRDYTIYVADPAGSLTLNSPLTSGVPLVKSGAGTLILNNASNAFSDLYFNQGVVRADAAGKLGGSGALSFFGGTLRFDGAFDPTTSKAITFGTGGGTFDTNGNNISLANSLGSGAGSFTKIGAGILTLAAGATFSGGSSIQQGRLIVTNGSGSATGAGVLTINGGVSTQASLGGAGIIEGGVTLATNGATSFAQGPSINPGTIGGAGTLTINTTALTTNDFSSLFFDLDAANTVGGGINDLISTNIIPVFNGSTQVNINTLGTLTGGFYTLINGYTGTISTFDNISLNTTFTGVDTARSGFLVNDANQLRIFITGATPTTAYWSGANDAFWNNFNTGGSPSTNWRTDATGGVDTLALPGSTTDVFFQTTTPTAANLATTLGQALSIKTLNFTADATSPVSISGNSLTLTPASSATGLSINAAAGAVTINSDVVLGAAQTWTNDSSSALTVNGEVSGVASLTKAGNGTVVLNGANTYVGNTTLSAGTLVAGNFQALGLAANTLTLNGGILDLASNASTTAKNTTVGGNVTINSNLATPGVGITHTLGALTIGAQTLSLTKGPNVTSGTAGLSFGATDIGTGGVVFDAAAGTALTITGIISGGPGNSDQTNLAANTAMTIKGLGSVTFTNTGNTFTGDIVVDGGGFNVDNTRDWGSATVASSTSKTVTLLNGGRLNVTSGTLNPGALTTTSYTLVQIGSGGGTIDVASGAALQLDDAGQLFGSATLTKVGNGTLSLRNQGTFSGQILVTAGLLQPVGGTGSNLGTIDAGTTIQSGAALNLNGINIVEAEPLTISGTGLAASPAGVITNSSGTGATFLGPVNLAANSTIGAAAAGGLTLSGGITGGFDLTVNNLAAGGTTLSTTAVNNAGAITNISSGTGGLTISASLGSSVTSIVQNSPTSTLSLTGNNSAFSGPIQIKAGTLTANLTGVATTLGDGSATNTITLGDSSGSNNATLNGVNNVTYLQNLIIASGNTGIARINAGTTTGSTIFAGTITLNTHDVVLGKLGTTGASQFTGGITGTGNVTILNEATTGTITLATGAVNPVGSITHTSTATGATTISAAIGSNVNGIIQNSATSALTLSNPSIAFNGPLTVNAGTLNFTGGAASGPTVTGLTVAAGSTLNLNNTVGQHFNLGGGALSLGVGTGASTLTMELGSQTNYDRFSTSAVATTANSVVLNLLGITGFEEGDYDLITAGSGLGGATYTVGVAGALGGFSLALTTSDSLVRLSSTVNNGTYYWNGGVNSSWAGFNGVNSNFTNDLPGTINAAGVPGTANSVIFSTSTQTVTALATTMDGPMSIKDLTFNNQLGSGPLASISIAPGLAGTLTLTPTVATAGINVQTGAPASITISAPVILGTNQTWNVADAATNLASSGGISGTANFIKDGDGIVTLSGTNNYVGTTTVNDGVLRAGGTNGFNQTSAHTVNAGAILRLNDFAATVGSLAGAGTVENGGATARALTMGVDNTSTTFSGVLQNGGTANLGIAKVGTGMMTLTGNNTMTGNYTVNGGRLAVTTGTTTNGTGQFTVGSVATTRGMLLIGNGATITTTDMDFGSNATNAAGAGYQTAGTVTLTAADGNGVFGLGNANTGYGYYEISGGTVSMNRLTLSNTGTTGTGVFRQTGGIVNIGTWTTVGHGSGSALLDIEGGTYNSGTNFAMGVSDAGAFSVTNVRGTGTLVAANGSTLLTNRGDNAARDNMTNMLNLLTGGTIRTASGGINNGTTTGATNNLVHINLNGGTIITNQATTSLININNTNSTLTANSGAFIYSGGLTVDTNGLNSTIPAPLRAPTGVGVQSIAVSTEGTGYIGAPIVRITGGSGAGATAVANMVDDGSGNGTYKVGSVTITNPGTGYLNTDVLTVSFVDNASVYTTQATLGAVSFNGGNVSGGLTKTGAGILTLSGGNTYTGGTIINAGTVALGVANALADTGNVTITGGTFDVSTFNDTVATISLQSGSITGTTGVLTSTANYDLRSGSVSAILAGSVGLDKTTAGTVTLSGANTYSGVTSITAGTLAFSAANNLGNASANNTITLNGATLNYTGSSSINLAANQVMTIGSSGGTLNVADASGTLNLLGGITTSTAANLTKTGLGTVSVNGSVDLNGGNVTVSAGVLNSGFTATGLGAIDVAGGATLNLYNGAATTMAISGLTLANGSSLGFDLNGSGINDVLNLSVAPSITSTVSLNFNNLGGMPTGSLGVYDLINTTTGTFNAGHFILGLAPSGFNYSFSTFNSDQTLRLTTSPLVLRYWTGDQDGNWNTDNGPGNTNWASTADGLTELGALPTATDTLVFSATNAVGPTLTTTLNNVAVIADSLRFINAPTTPATTTVTIASGGAGGILTINPISANNGITVAAAGGDVTISAPVVALANQTWEVIGTTPSSLTVSGDVTFTGSVNKTGAGSLTLSGSNTGAGGVNLAAGSLVIANNNALGTGTFTIGAGTTINTGAGAITNAGNNVQNWAGNFTFAGTNALNLGTGAVTLADNVIATVSAQTLTIGGAIGDGASTFGLTKAGAGTLTLSGANTYGGLTSLTAGTLNLNGNNSGAAGGVTMAASTNLNIGHANALGTGAFTINGGTIDNTSGAPLTLGLGVVQNWNGNFTFTGTNNLDTGSGAVTLGANTQITTNAGTLTVSGIIDDGANTFGITKTGTGTLVLSGLSTTASSNYGGTTTLNAGITNITTAAAFTGGLTFGAATSNTTATTLNLTNGATFAGNVLVQNRTTTANIINISSGQTLTLNGNLTVGAADPGAVGVSSLLTMNGGGNLAVSTATGGLFQVGGSTSGTNSLNSVLDLTGLATASINVSNTGTVRVNQPNGTNLNGNRASLLLPTPTVALNTPVTTITAANLNIGDNGGNNGAAGQVNTVTLGTGLTTLNVNTINIGTGGRDMGQLNFASGNGTLIVRAADGIGRTAINIGTGTVSTGVAPGAGVTNNMTLTGRSSDLLISTLTIGGQNRNTNRTDTFSFDIGVLDATTVVVGDNGTAANTTASNNTWTSTLNIGGGTTTIGTGGLEIARGDTAVTGTDVIEGTVNISGGTVSIANSTGLAAAVRLGHNTIATGLTTTGALNITGGAVTVSGHIIKGSTTGTGSATLTLNGGSLNMSGNNIGAASPTVTFNAQQGTLQNVAQINGGTTGLTKTTAGTLILEGTNTYTGGTTISAGTVQVGGGTLGTGSVTGTLGSGDISNSGTLTINRSNSYTLANNISGTGAFIQAGLGTTILGGTNTYTGKTTISAGKLSIDSEARLGDNPGTSTGDQLTLAGGTLQTTANLTIDDANRGITVSAASAIETASGTTATISSTILGGAALSKEGAGTLIFTAVQTGLTGTVTVNGGTLAGLGGTGGDLVVASSGTLSPGVTGTPGAFTVTGSLTVSTGGTLATQIGGATTNAAAAVLAEMNANGNLLSLIGSVPSAWESYLNGTTAHSHTLVSGTASAPAITGTVAFIGGYSPVYGDVFDILDWGFSGAMTSTPSAFDFGGITLGSGLAFNTDLFASNGIIVVVPEPSRALFLMLGLFGLMLRRRRK